MVTPNVSGLLMPSLSVKTTLAPGTAAHDWFATEHTGGSPSHVPSAAPHGVTSEADHAVADSGTREPDNRFATGAQAAPSVGRVHRTTCGGVPVSRYRHVTDPLGSGMMRTMSFVASGRHAGVSGNTGGFAGSSTISEPTTGRARRLSLYVFPQPQCR